jgi:MiaB-like tRNA modifying enzyme
MIKRSRPIYVKSFGCSANRADGEVIVGCLSKAGFKVVENPQDAEVLIYNTCAVKTPTENRIISILKKTPKDKHLIVTGCLPIINFERLKKEVDFDGVTGPAPGKKIVEVLLNVNAGKKIVFLKESSEKTLFLPKISVNPVISIIPINYGCLGNCSYCCVHFARGELRSNPIHEIVDRVRQDLFSGYKEVWLTSQDTACFGKDIGTNLPDLLKEICLIEGDFFVRIGMMNPNRVICILDDLIDGYKNEKVFKFLHLPVQSGDNEVLRLMNRCYKVEDFKRIVQAFRKEIPRITISTDIICGFPTESKEAFERTKKLVNQIQPDVINISKFFPRPNTNAEELESIPPIELKRRSREITKLSNEISLKKNQKWINWEGPVLFNEKGKGESWMGRNFAYKPIVVKTNEELLGNFIPVRVVKVFSTYLEAIIF